ncbi:MAG: pentapeptide repeat-containing protein [Moorea sp. SIO3I7]|nr:pentapeptide repeat-containing protein [Moorena sp. SIO3I7]
MKANEVLRRYAEGERDFRRVNLRGQSFQGKDLSGADFSEADIRGTNFKNANLKGTKFCKAKAGLQKRWVIVLLLVSWIGLGLSGFISFLSGTLLASSIFINNDVEAQVLGWIALVAIIVFFTVSIRQGIGVAIAVALAIAVAIAIAGTFILSGYVIFAVAGAVALAGAGSLAGAIARALYLAIDKFEAINGYVTFAVAGAIALAMAGAVALAGALTLAGVVTSKIYLLSFSMPTGYLAGVLGLAESLGIVPVLPGSLIGTYLGIRAIKGDPRDAWIRTIAIACAATGGTNFYKADLTDADFTGAILKNTDLREATITHTCWQNTIKLDRARPGKTILADTAVRELLVRGNGYNKSYVEGNLRGANLRGANLNKANLKLADLSEATLEDANLEWANLTEANCVGTDFTHVYLTGACLEAWNIDSTTTLTNIDCQYVFLIENPNDMGSRERRPHDPNRVFKPGDFDKLYKQIMNTVQILLRNGVNPEAFRQAFQELMAENPEINGDSIQAIEKKGNDVLLTLEIPDSIDKGKVERQFFEVYEARLEAAKQTALLEAERSHNQDFKEIVRAAFTSNQSSNPIINLTNTAKSESDMSDNSRNFNIDQSQATNPKVNTNPNFAVANDNARQFNTTNFTSEQTQSLAEAAAEIQQLLQQLEKNNPTATEAQQEAFVSAAITPTKKERLINAIKEGGQGAIEEFLDNPYLNVAIRIIEGWRNP